MEMSLRQGEDGEGSSSGRVFPAETLSTLEGPALAGGACGEGFWRC